MDKIPEHERLDDIEVTLAMVEAGMHAFSQHDERFDDIRSTIPEIFRAMGNVKISSSG
jgi:hypothetical protein